MASATISTLTMTDDSGCCKYGGATFNTPTTATPPNHLRKKDASINSISENHKNHKKNNNEHIRHCFKLEDKFVASENESFEIIQNCKHSAVIRKSNNIPLHLIIANKISSTTRTTTTVAVTKLCALFVLLLICCSLPDYAHAALSNVNLFIEPPAVRRGQSVILRCQYALEGAPLYSIKYYRGSYEFYRYTPGEFPYVKYFQYPGIKVDEHISNATQVVLRDVNFSLSGNFSCEVTADAPLFSTSTAYAQVQVVEFPEKRPQLFTEHARYEPGDILRANCSTPPSRPRADLHFTINNIPVSTDETQYIRTVDNLIASRLSLKLQLHAAHFAAAINTQHLMNHLSVGSQSSIGLSYSTHGMGVVSNGGLILRCTAQIGDLYQEYKEIELGTPQRDPVPARVTLSSGSSIRNFFETYFSSAPTSSASSTTHTPLSSIHRTIYPLKLTILAAAVWRSQALFHGITTSFVFIYNTLKFKQVTLANR